MDHMISFCISSVCHIVTRSKAVGPPVLTSSKHALHEVVNIAKNDSEALWRALLPNQRLDLDTLQYGLRYSGIGIHARVEYCTGE